MPHHSQLLLLLLLFWKRADRRPCRRRRPGLGRGGVSWSNDCLICLAGIFTSGAHDENSKNLTAREEEEEEEEEIMSPLEVVLCITRFRAKLRPLPAFSPGCSTPLRCAFTERFSYLTSAMDTATPRTMDGRRRANGP